MQHSITPTTYVHHIIAIITVYLFLNSQSLLETHDSVASKNYETPPPSPCSFMDAALNNQPVPPDAVRMVGIRKVSGEHLVSLLDKWFGLSLLISNTLTLQRQPEGQVCYIKVVLNFSNCLKG